MTGDFQKVVLELAHPLTYIPLFQRNSGILTIFSNKSEASPTSSHSEVRLSQTFSYYLKKNT